MAHTVLPILCGVLLAGGAAAGFEQSLELPSVNEAMAIGESRFETVRTRYHQPYRIPVARPPVDYVEVITPFRQIVLIAEERTRSGARPLSQRDTLVAAGDRLGLVEVFVEFTFHPMSSYVGVPPYDVEFAVATPPRRITPAQKSSIPRFGARVAGGPRPSGIVPLNVPGPSEPMLGGTVIAGFDALALDPIGVYDVVISEKGKELARARVNLGSMR